MTMARKSKEDQATDTDPGMRRRDFFKTGAAAGLGVAFAAASGTALADQHSPEDIHWDYEADVVILGSGSVGLVAAVRAHDLGADVLVLEANYDVGGKLVHSGGWTSLGGGDATQHRDIAGADPENRGLTSALV